MWKEWELKTGNEMRCPESLGEKGTRKTENVTGGLGSERSGKSGRRMENNSDRLKVLETGDREHSARKLRRGKKR